MANLTNVYAYLRDQYTNVDMMLAKPPSFIKTLIGDENQKVILIFKEDRSKVSNFRSPLSSEGEKISDLNITGSPLQDDNSINDLINTSIVSNGIASKAWQDVEETYTPIDINVARDILNDIINQDFAKGSCGWIYILCNDENVPASDSTFILSTCLEKKNFCRGLANYHGVIKGEDKSFENLAKIVSYSLHNGSPDIKIESIFELTPYISVKFINNAQETNCSLNHINEYSDVILKQKVEIGKSHMLLENLWNQVQLLNAIKTDILMHKNNSIDGTMNEPNYSYGSMTYESLQEKVNRILSEVVTITDNEEEGDNQLEAVIRRLYNRPLSEITDQLWDLLRFTSSYTDLKRIFTFVFQISSRSSIVNVPMNNNRMAELIRELSQQRLAIPHLTSTEPLELLLEIGIEKVMKDYEYIFSESKICMLSDISIGGGKMHSKVDNNRLSVRKSIAAIADLNQNARKTLLHTKGSLDSTDEMDDIRNSRFNERDVDKSISTLAKIHLTVEHMLMIQNHLNLENDYASMAKKMLELPLVPFEDLQTQKHDKFQFQLNDKKKKIVQLVDNLNPNIQKITMQSENKFQAVKSIFYYNIEQIVPFLVGKENEGDVIDKKGNTYHFISYSNITSKF